MTVSELYAAMNIAPKMPVQISPKPDTNVQKSSAADKLESELEARRGANGFIGKISDKIKTLCGSKLTLKNLEKDIADVKNNKKDAAEVQKFLKDYQYQQREIREITTDVATGFAAFTVFRKVKTLGFLADAFTFNKLNAAKYFKIAAMVLAPLTAMFTKPIIKAIDSIGIKKEQYKEERTILRDMATGIVDGALAPLAMANMLIGLPVIAAVNSLSRYIFTKKDDKSFKDMFAQQTQNIAPKAAAAAILILAAWRAKAKIKGWSEAAQKALKNVENLKVFKAVEKPLEFEELVQQIKIMENPKLTDILNNSKLSLDEKMRKIEEFNLFVPKYLQTIPDNLMEKYGNKELGEIVTRFKSSCALSRTIEQAQEVVSKVYGSKYILIGDKPLGVGTVAEAYLAKEAQTGKEVVIKILKDGMSLEKINADKKAIYEFLDASEIHDASRKDYFKRRIDSLFDAWAKEVDLAGESKAAKVLGKNARGYNAVVPIEVKDNVYVMERAKGIQLNELVDELHKQGKTITTKDFIFIMANYFKVFMEQLLSVPKKGMKIMHADPHPGNIFVDIDNLEKPYTFIDTGNVLSYTPKKAIQNLFSHLDYFIGNSRALAAQMLDGASLPEGMTMKQAITLVEKELKERAFNGSVKIADIPFKVINDLCLDIMQRHNIIANPNNTNLLKAEATYFSNLFSLKGIKKVLKEGEDNGAFRKALQEMQGKMKIIAWETGRSLISALFNKPLAVLSEIRKRLNFIKNNKEQFFTSIYSYTKPIKNEF